MVRRKIFANALTLMALFTPSFAGAAGVEALFELDVLANAPFPSDRFTVLDESQNTGLRIKMPRPAECEADPAPTPRPSDCVDIDLLNELDGFNVQPRLSIPFSGQIDVASVSSQTVLLIRLGNASRLDPRGDQDDDGDDVPRTPYGPPIGINQIVWDIATNTLHVESDELLNQHARYALIVTRGVKDVDGNPVGPSAAFERFRHGLNFGQSGDHALKGYRRALLRGLAYAQAAGVGYSDIVAASVFTTMSVSAVLEKIRSQVAGGTPEPADFLLGPIGPDGARSRTIFPLSFIQSITVREQVSTAPAFTVFTTQVALLRRIPDAVGTVAFGAYRSPVYLNAERSIPQVATRTGVPAANGEEQLYFILFLPAATVDRPRPPRGWPVVIYGSGCCLATNKYRGGGSFNVAAKLAQHGLATMAIDPPGAGFGPLSTFAVSLTGGVVVTFPSGGRGRDVDGDGTIAAGEGGEAGGTTRILLSRDVRRQAVADMMQLVRVVHAGVDGDGDGMADLDASRIYYLGHSNGAQNGAPLVATEPGIRGAVLNAAGGLVAERLRLSPSNRSTLGELLASRQPSLVNLPDPGGMAFEENLPLRNQPPVINTVPGAMEIQAVFERMEWLYMPADAAAFAPFLRRTPLVPGPGTPLILQLAKGDTTVPNPATTAIIRAGELADRTTYYRTDIAVERPTPPPGIETNGHNFLIRMNSAARTAIALTAQEQVAVFFESDGADTIDPDGECLLNLPDKPGCLFEVPIEGPLPEDLGFIQ